MSIAIKRTLIRPKGREEYESNTSTQVVTLATQEVVQQATQVIVQNSGNGSGSGSGGSTASYAIPRAGSGVGSTSSNLPYYAGENIVVRDREISSPKSVQSQTVKNVKVMTQDEYNSLTAYTSDTLYFCYVPEFSALTAAAIQTTKVAESGITLNSSNLSSYFTLTATEVFNDGSMLDVSSAATFSMTEMVIGANTTGVERSVSITDGITATWNGHTTNFDANLIQYS